MGMPGCLLVSAPLLFFVFWFRCGQSCYAHPAAFLVLFRHFMHSTLGVLRLQLLYVNSIITPCGMHCVGCRTLSSCYMPGRLRYAVVCCMECGTLCCWRPVLLD
jgi:hypothetical protein